MRNLKTAVLRGLLAAGFLGTAVFASPIADKSVIPASEDFASEDGWQSVTAVPATGAEAQFLAKIKAKHMSSTTEVSTRANSDVSTEVISTSIQKRVFTSPHMKRAFECTVKGFLWKFRWVVDYSVQRVKDQYGNLVTHVFYKLMTKENTFSLTDPLVNVVRVTTLDGQDTLWTGIAYVQMTGHFGINNVKAEFDWAIFADDNHLAYDGPWQHEPELWIEGVKYNLESWAFSHV